VFLDLQGKPVLVVGGGPVALRKTRGLVEAGARVTVVAPSVVEEFASLPVRIERREFAPAGLRGFVLVFAATNRREVNAAIARDCERQGIWVNVADARQECTFVTPARVVMEGVQIAISTDGRDPRHAAAVRRLVEAALGARQVKSE
jgi:siroheme synthase-like protein